MLGFVSPVISFGLIVLYYLPEIVKSLCKECKEKGEDSIEFTEFTYEETRTTSRKEKDSSKMDSFSKDTLEDMK